MRVDKKFKKLHVIPSKDQTRPALAAIHAARDYSELHASDGHCAVRVHCTYSDADYAGPIPTPAWQAAVKATPKGEDYIELQLGETEIFLANGTRYPRVITDDYPDFGVLWQRIEGRVCEISSAGVGLDARILTRVQDALGRDGLLMRFGGPLDPVWVDGEGCNALIMPMRL